MIVKKKMCDCAYRFLFPGWFDYGVVGGQKVNYWRSPQYKIDRIVAEQRPGFTIGEVMGTDWQAVCFLPASYIYSHNEEELAQWLPVEIQTHLIGRISR